MAKKDISKLLNKKENQGLTAEGRLSVTEFKDLVTAVMENQDDTTVLHKDIDAVNERNKANVKTVTYKGQRYKPDETGNVILVDTESKYNLSADYSISKTAVSPGQDVIVSAKIVHEEYVKATPDKEAHYEPSKFPVTINYYFGDQGRESLIYVDKAMHGSTSSLNLKDYIKEGMKDPSVYIKISNGFTEDVSGKFILTVLSLSMFLEKFNPIDIKKDDWILYFNTTSPQEYPPTIYIQIDENPPVAVQGKPGKGQSGQWPIDEKTTYGNKSGARLLKVWAEITHGEGESKEIISTDKYITEYIYVNEETVGDELLVATNMYNYLSVPRYENIKLKYWIYKQGVDNEQPLPIHIYLSNEPDGSPIDSKFETTQNVKFKDNSSPLSEWVLSLVGSSDLLEGKKYLIIECQNTKKAYELTITPSEVELIQDPGYEIYLSAAGRKNSDLNKDDWSCKNFNNSKTYKMRGMDRLEYASYGSGWVTHPDGSTSLHLRKGNKLYLDYEPFNRPITYKRDGKGLTLSFEIATSNSTSKDAIAISCYGPGKNIETGEPAKDDEDYNTGILIKSNEVFFSGQGQSISCPFKEEDRVRIDIVIEGKEKTYNFVNGKVWKESIVWLYIDGVYQRMYIIPGEDKGISDYSQNIPTNIEIGSDECDVDIYNIRVYETALNVRSILNNYAYDMPIPSEKINIQKRNSCLLVINENGDTMVDRDSLKISRPELPVLFIDLFDSLLPTKKDRQLVIKTDYVNPMKSFVGIEHSPELDYSNATFIVGGAPEGTNVRDYPGGAIGCQGSSSMRYPSPYKNYDWRSYDKKLMSTKGMFEYENKHKAEKYSLYPNMPPINKITLKKDYASSEMVNNIICSELFTDMAAGLNNAEKYGSPTQAMIADDMAKIYRLSLKGIPIFMFYNKKGPDDNLTPDPTYKDKFPLGMFNMIPNKKEVDYLGFTEFTDTYGGEHHFIHEGFDPKTYEPIGSEAQSWEIRDNFEFMEDIFEPAKWDYLNTEVKNPNFSESAADDYCDKHNISRKVLEDLFPYADLNYYTKPNPLDPTGPEIIDEEKGKLSIKLATLKLEKRWRIGSVFDSYETRTPEDSQFYDGDYGEHVKTSYVSDTGQSPEVDEEGKPILVWKADDPNFIKERENELIGTRVECETLRQFHNFVASCNPDKVSAKDDLKNQPVTLKEIYRIAHANKSELPEEEQKLYERYKAYNVVLNAKSSEEVHENDAYMDIEGKIFTTDCKEYRLAKFKTEGSYYWNNETSSWVEGGHFRLDQWLLYYIWMEQFWMMDSGSKNLQVYTMGHHFKKVPCNPEENQGKKFKWVEDLKSPFEWGVMVRDADTGLGIDNQGSFAFPPYLEDIDFYSRSETDELKKFEYNYPEKLNNIMPDPKPTPGSRFQTPVLNGQQGVMWKNIRRCYGGPSGKLAEVYKDLLKSKDRTKFNYTNTLEKFENYQAAWSEALYDFGAMQYHGSGPRAYWIESGLGDKKHQRRNWLYYGFRYRQSKYNTSDGVNNISFKLYNPGKPVTVQMQTYTPIYTRTGNKLDDKSLEMENYHRHVDLTKTVDITIRSSANEITWFLQDGDLYTDLGDIYKIGGKTGGFAGVVPDLTGKSKLKNLRLGYYKDKVNYKNTVLYQLELGDFKELEFLDITNCVDLGIKNYEGKLNVSGMNQLRELYFENTLFHTVYLPETGTLETIWANPGMHSIKLENLPNLKDFTICDHIYHDDKKEWEIKETYNDPELGEISTYGKVASITIHNCPKLDTYFYIEKTINNGVLNFIDIDTVDWQNASAEVVRKLIELKANISGHINIPGKNRVDFEFKKYMLDNWGNIDDPENKVYVTYEERKVESLQVVESIYYRKPGDYHLTFTPDPNLGNDWTGWEWTIEPNEFATVDPDGTVHVTQIGEEIYEPKANATITLHKKNGSTISAKIPLYFYNRVAKPGYYVFKDGSFGPNLEGKKPIGICFWVDPTNDQNRLMFATMHLSDAGRLGWGPTHNSNSDLVIPGEEDLILSKVPGIPEIPGFIGVGSSSGLTKVELTDDQYYRDFENGDKNNFTRYDSSQFFAQIGMDKLEEPLEDYVLGDEVPEFKYNVGDKIPYGKHFTLRIISFRNKILKILGKELPKKTYNETEYANLVSLIKKEGSGDNNFAKGLIYFPAASACYSYSPLPTTGAEDEAELDKKLGLDDKFKEGNWFLPTAGELARIQYYLRKSSWGDASSPEYDENNIFQKAIDDKVLSSNYEIFKNDNFFKTSSVSTSYLDDTIAGLDTYSKELTGSIPKGAPYLYPILPICQF